MPNGNGPSSSDDKKMMKKVTDEIISLRGQFIPHMIKWVCDPDAELDANVDKQIAQILRDRKKRFKVFLIGLSKKHVERIVYLFSKFPLIEDELFRKERIETAKTADLIRLMAEMSRQTEDAADFIRTFISDEDLRSDPLPSGTGFVIDTPDEDAGMDGVEITEAEVEVAEGMSLESRRRVTRVLRKVLNVIDVTEEKTTLVQSTKKLPPPDGKVKSE